MYTRPRALDRRNVSHVALSLFWLFLRSTEKIAKTRLSDLVVSTHHLSCTGRRTPHTGPGHGVEEPAPLRWGTKGAKYQPTRKLEFVALGSAGDAPALGDGLAEVAIHRRSLAVGTIHHATHAPECSKPRVLCTPQTV